MCEQHAYLVLAFYQYQPIADPHEEVRLHKEFFKGRDITSRIYISEEGINGQMSGSKKDATAYMDWMHTRDPFKELYFKIHFWHEQVFPRQVVKYREQIVALDRKVDPAKGGEHVSPEEWQRMLEGDEDHILIDVRNDYESKIGHFEGAELPRCNTFREFNAYADELEKRVDRSKPVMMYCTGGIRCEVYSALLKEKGFEKVYQLDGGVINYGLKVGSKKWLGKLYVFDDRMAVPISEEDTEVIGQCHFCEAKTENYYNCANMDCNELFLCCSDCLNEFAGCCQESCANAPRVRPCHQQNPHKPFRKYYHYFKERKIS